MAGPRSAGDLTHRRTGAASNDDPDPHRAADGSDAGGSLRNPPAFCNVVGLRPSPGRVPNESTSWSPLSVAGPIARTVADVGLFLLYWGQSEAQIIATGQAIDEQAGFASRDEIVELYAKRTGRDVEHLDFYVVFAFYKLAIIVEGIAARYRMGKTLGEGFEHMGEMVKSLVHEALDQANRSSIPALRG